MIPILTVRELGIQLAASEKPLVQSSSLTLQAGKTLAIVGESGSGKSLTALALMQLLGPQFTTSGEVTFDGKQLQGHSAGDKSAPNMQSIRGNDMAMIFQEPMTALNPLHTIGRQISEAITIHQPAPSNTGAYVTSLLEQVGLAHFTDKLHSYPHQLSGGERQRVMIAMAIANKPKLLIADEPTTALDVHVEKTILELLAKLQAELGMAMIFITHDLPLVKKIADDVAVMRHGQIVEHGPCAQLFENPAHDYTKHLLASLPKGEPVPMPAKHHTLLNAEHMSVKFPIKKRLFGGASSYKTALDSASFTIASGETLGVVGGSGSGKTTLAMALLRMQSFSGRAVFMGSDLATLSRRQLRAIRADMQLVFQDPFSSLNPRMTVGQIIREGLSIHLPKMESPQDRIIAMLEKTGLSADMMHRYPHEFSGGQRQRIAIARAMILEPKLVILDEPTSALDVTVQMQVLELLKDFQREEQLSYLFITHDLRVIRTIAHRLLVLEHGHIVEHGQTHQVLSTPKHPYTQMLVDAAL